MIAERGPKTDASNGGPTAAELGNPTVNATRSFLPHSDVPVNGTTKS